MQAIESYLVGHLLQKFGQSRDRISNTLRSRVLIARQCLRTREPVPVLEAGRLSQAHGALGLDPAIILLENELQGERLEENPGE